MDADLLTQLAQARAAEATAGDELKRLQSTPIYVELSTRKKTAAELVKTLTTQVRQFYHTILTASGKDSLPKGTNVRDMTRLEYDEEAAIKWAKENMPVAVLTTLDRKPFEDYAKKVADDPKRALPFVRIAKEPEITISQDLSFLLQPVVEPVQQGEPS